MDFWVGRRCKALSAHPFFSALAAAKRCALRARAEHERTADEYDYEFGDIQPFNTDGFQDVGCALEPNDGPGCDGLRVSA